MKLELNEQEMILLNKAIQKLPFKKAIILIDVINKQIKQQNEIAKKEDLKNIKS